MLRPTVLPQHPWMRRTELRRIALQARSQLLQERQPILLQTRARSEPSRQARWEVTDGMTTTLQEKASVMTALAALEDSQVKEVTARVTATPRDSADRSPPCDRKARRR